MQAGSISKTKGKTAGKSSAKRDNEAHAMTDTKRVKTTLEDVKLYASAPAPPPSSARVYASAPPFVSNKTVHVGTYVEPPPVVEKPPKSSGFLSNLLDRSKKYFLSRPVSIDIPRLRDPPFIPPVQKTPPCVKENALDIIEKAQKKTAKVLRICRNKFPTLFLVTDHSLNGIVALCADLNRNWRDDDLVWYIVGTNILDRANKAKYDTELVKVLLNHNISLQFIAACVADKTCSTEELEEAPTNLFKLSKGTTYDLMHDEATAVSRAATKFEMDENLDAVALLSNRYSEECVYKFEVKWKNLVTGTWP